MPVTKMVSMSILMMIFRSWCTDLPLILILSLGTDFFTLRICQNTDFFTLTDSVHSAAYSGTRSIELCHTAAVSGTMKLVFHIFSRSKISMEHQFYCAADTGGMAYVYRASAAVGGGMDGIR